MNKTLGSTLITSGTMIGAGMLAMPLTSAGIGFTFTVVLLCALWVLLTYSALLFVEVYQTAEYDAGIGTLAAQPYLPLMLPEVVAYLPQPYRISPHRNSK